MIFIEIRHNFPDDSKIILSYTKMQVNMSMDEAIDYVTPMFKSNSVNKIYLKDVSEDQVILLESPKEDLIVKSFLLNFLELEKLF